jgi:hypothetical protein
MHRLALLAVGLALVGSPFVSEARGGGESHGSHSSGGSKSVQLDGHYTKSGTYVRPHDRNLPGEGSSRPHSKSTGSSYHKRTTGSGGPGSAQRDSHGKIKRSAAAKAAFRHSHPCPSTGKTSGVCPGYVVDHVRALKSGGKDSPDNMAVADDGRREGQG